MDGSSRSEGLPQIYGPPIGDRIIKSLSEKSQIESLSETESHADDIGIQTLIRQPVVQNRQEPAPLENRMAENLTGKLVDDLTAAKGENKEKLSKIRSETLIKVAKIAAVAILTTVVVVALTAAAAGCCVVPGGAILVVPLGILAMGAIAGGVMIGSSISSSSPQKYTKEEAKTFEKNKANINEALKLNEKYPQTETSNGRSFEEFMTKKQSEQGRLFQVADLDNYSGLYKQERLKNNKQMVRDDLRDVNDQIADLTTKIASDDYTESDKKELKELKETQKSLSKELNDKNEVYDPEKVAEFKGAIADSNQRAAQMEAAGRAGGANGADVVNPQQGGGRDGAGLVNPQGAGRPEGANGPQNRGVVPNPFESVESGEGLDVMPPLQNQINDKKEYVAQLKKGLNKENEDLKTSENNIIAAKKQLITLNQITFNNPNKNWAEEIDGATVETRQKLDSDVTKFERLHALSEKTTEEREEYFSLSHDPLIFARILTREQQRSDDIKNIIPQIKGEIERTTAEITRLESRKLAEQGVGRARANPQQNVAREGILFDSEVDGTDSDAASESVESGEGGDIMPSLQDQIKVKNAQVARLLDLNETLEKETEDLNASEIQITVAEIQLSKLHSEKKTWTEELNNIKETAENRVKLDSDVDRFDKLRAKTLKTKAEQKEYNALNNNPLIHAEIHRLGQQESTRLNRSIENTKAEIKQLEKQPQIPNQKSFEAKIEQKLSALDSSEDESEFSELTGLLTTPVNKGNQPQTPITTTTRIVETREAWVESADSSEDAAPIRQSSNAQPASKAIDDELESLVNSMQPSSVSRQNAPIDSSKTRPGTTTTTKRARVFETADYNSLMNSLAELEKNPRVEPEIKQTIQDNQAKITENDKEISNIRSRVEEPKTRRDRQVLKRNLETSNIVPPFNVEKLKSNAEVLKTKNSEIEKELQAKPASKEAQSLVEQKVSNERVIKNTASLEEAFNVDFKPMIKLKVENENITLQQKQIVVEQEIIDAEKKISSLPDEIVAKGNQLRKLKDPEEIKKLDESIKALKNDLIVTKKTLAENKEIVKQLADQIAENNLATTNNPLNASSAATAQAPDDVDQKSLSPEQKQRLKDAGIEYKENTPELREAVGKKIQSLNDEGRSIYHSQNLDLEENHPETIASNAMAQEKYTQAEELSSIFKALQKPEVKKTQEQVAAKAQEEPALVSAKTPIKNTKETITDDLNKKIESHRKALKNYEADSDGVFNSQSYYNKLTDLNRSDNTSKTIINDTKTSPELKLAHENKIKLNQQVRNEVTKHFEDIGKLQQQIEELNRKPIEFTPLQKLTSKVAGDKVRLERLKRDLMMLGVNPDTVDVNQKLRGLDTHNKGVQANINKNEKSIEQITKKTKTDNAPEITQLREEIKKLQTTYLENQKLMTDIRTLSTAYTTLGNQIIADEQKLQILRLTDDKPANQ